MPPTDQRSGLLTSCEAGFEGYDPEGATERLVAWLDSAAYELDSPAGAFWQAVGANLREGQMRLVFVADEIPASLQRLVVFLNEQMPRVEVLALRSASTGPPAAALSGVLGVKVVAA